MNIIRGVWDYFFKVLKSGGYSKGVCNVFGHLRPSLHHFTGKLEVLWQLASFRKLAWVGDRGGGGGLH